MNDETPDLRLAHQVASAFSRTKETRPIPHIHSRGKPRRISSYGIRRGHRPGKLAGPRRPAMSRPGQEPGQGTIELGGEKVQAMSALGAEKRPVGDERTPVPLSDIDRALTAQLMVAWAGESGADGDSRLGWWRSDLVSEFGGQDLFKRLLPGTWRWAMFQGAREAARRVDAEQRRKDNDPDRLVSLFRLGFELDEQIDERFQDLKRSGRKPQEALPELAIVFDDPDDNEPDEDEEEFRSWADGGKELFRAWIDGREDVSWDIAPAGRRIQGPRPSTLGQRVDKLVAGLAPVADEYPLPHFRSEP